MQLEDHAGDVVAKARQGRGLAEAEVAQAAGLDLAEYQALESTGRISGVVDWAALEKVLGLAPGRLGPLLKGWVPARRDLGCWRELRQVTTVEGMAVNSYLAWDEASREAALFDTGWHAEPLLELVRHYDLKLTHCFITHSHADHVAALAELRRVCPGLRVRSSSPHAPVDQRNRPNDFVHIGNLRVTHRPTPGHAPDGVTYVIGTWPEDAPAVAIVGDA